MHLFQSLGVLLILGAQLPIVECQDDLGIGHGYINLDTPNFHAVLARDSQVLVSLKAAGDDFDFLPFDYIERRTRNGQYHWGDIIYRYRDVGTSSWISGDSAAARQPVTAISDSISNLNLTLPSSPLNITRQWRDFNGDLGLFFSIQNSGNAAIEIGSLGFPAEFNSIFTDRDTADMAAFCSLSDPYIGMHAGYIRVTPTQGTGASLVVTPIGDTPLEAYRNLEEPYFGDTAYASQTFEGFYEWQVLTKAWAENEWVNVEPWNTPSSKILAPGDTLEFGLRFQVSLSGVRALNEVVRSAGVPVARSVPGYVIPRDSEAKLWIKADSDISAISVDPEGSLVVAAASNGLYTVTPSATAWGRVRLTVHYADAKVQTIHYYVTKSGTEAVKDLGRHSTTAQWFTDTSDPFGRAPSVMTYDYEEKAIVTQDPRVWVAGLSDDAGAGAYLATMVKQALQPNAEEISQLESFVDDVLWKTIQVPDYGVRRSIFFYEPSAVPGYEYNSSIDWTSWTSWDKSYAYSPDRAYNYVHVAAAYWALYRVGRSYPTLVKSHTWDWYLNQSYSTVVRGMNPGNNYVGFGLMGETVFGEILADLARENLVDEAGNLTEILYNRAVNWNNEAYPFGSEQAWDSTGQEGVYYWTKYFGFTDAALKTVNSVLGFMPTVPHWGWNGNARRYWDNIFGGKLRRIERQIHHYGSGLNALVMLGAFRSDPSDNYLLQVGYGGISGALTNINQDGFGAASFHSYPDTLKWDGFSAEYGSNFVGLALGSGTYFVVDEEIGAVAYGGIVQSDGTTTTIQPRDPARKRVFIGPLGLLFTIDAGIIQEFEVAADGAGPVTITLSQLEDVPQAEASILWLETTFGSTKYSVSTPNISQVRGGWQIPFSGGPATIVVSQSDA